MSNKDLFDLILIDLKRAFASVTVSSPWGDPVQLMGR